MSGDRLTRAFRADLELRGDGRTVVGIACPFDEVADIGPYLEVFRRGAFRRTIRERGDRVKFLGQHDRGSFPLGRATKLREDARGLYAELRVSATERGDEALTLIRDGALDALSVAFEPVPGGDRTTTTKNRRTLIERVEVKLTEISAVPFGAYAGALIGAVRSRSLAAAEARRRLAAILEAYPL